MDPSANDNSCWDDASCAIYPSANDDWRMGKLQTYSEYSVWVRNIRFVPVHCQFCEDTGSRSTRIRANASNASNANAYKYKSANDNWQRNSE